MELVRLTAENTIDFENVDSDVLFTVGKWTRNEDSGHAFVSDKESSRCQCSRLIAIKSTVRNDPKHFDNQRKFKGIHGKSGI